ncbi:hypothetical protein U9M48_041994 [Paspalum notatum var. saurae]|uniref:SIAH-type domain-containing protein n=1 Tax=Paspalum notatum var. saurae TaxID=547442 RepID=A0AAQ3UVY6_PASNO
MLARPRRCCARAAHTRPQAAAARAALADARCARAVPAPRPQGRAPPLRTRSQGRAPGRPERAGGRQCAVGHVVCSPCSDKLKATTGKCYVCGVDTRYDRRCYDMEQALDLFEATCPYASHGCSVRPAYHSQERHRLVCVHAPCHCPGEDCSFVGSTEALLNHFSEVHSWPCTTNANAYGHSFAVWLHDGFNFVLADCNNEQGTTASVKRLLLLTVVRQPHARIISVHCIDPHAATASGGQGPNSKGVLCTLWYSVYGGSNKYYNHYQTSTFRIICTDLSNGVPKPDDCFQFVVPNSVIGDHDKDGLEVSFVYGFCHMMICDRFQSANLVENNVLTIKLSTAHNNVPVPQQSFIE